MGIHGLTTYLRENKRALSNTLSLPSPSEGHVSIVVDGWSFIYGLQHNSNLPWVYGGEYYEFCKLVSKVVNAWIKVGFKVYFVFDGACPELKFSTVISRLGQSHIQPSLLFFRTSTSSRATPRFLNETRIIPPQSYSACIHALQEIQKGTDSLEIHFADEEGDPYAVELAGRIGGYVVGNDSDFVVLNSEGYLGFIPLDEMVWYTQNLEDAPSLDSIDEEFQTVRKSKGKKKANNDPRTGRGPLPPEEVENATLSFTSYSPDALASHLGVPVTLLPLLGALVGNDFSGHFESNRRNVQSMFFDRNLTSTQRIVRVATTIRSMLSPASQKKKLKHQVGSVMDLIDRTVNALLTRLTVAMGSGEIESIVEKIVEATLQYAIPRYDGDIPGPQGLWFTNFCALHDPSTCQLLPFISRRVIEDVEESGTQNEGLLLLREAYLIAYRNGHLSPKTMDVLSTGSSWPRLFLEDPDLETVSRSIGRPIRQWIYSILDDTVGLPHTEADDVPPSEDETGTEEDEDELVDVVESDDEDNVSDTDYLASLKGELKRLHSDDEASEHQPSISSSHRHHPSSAPVVTEYLRRGTRVAQEPLAVTPLTELISSISTPDCDLRNDVPLLLKPEKDRISVLLRALKSDYASVRALSVEKLASVLALRWVVYSLHARAQETGSREREQEKWTKTEARCFLASFSWSDATIDEIPAGNDPPLIIDRNVQLTAQAMMAIESIEQLSQVLLLAEHIASVAHVFSGRTFHAHLTKISPLREDSVSPELWQAVEDGLEEFFQEERAKKAKKTKKEREDVAPKLAKGIKKGPTTKGMFAMLGDLEA